MKKEFPERIIESIHLQVSIAGSVIDCVEALVFKCIDVMFTCLNE